jgi:predicted phosphodiesterase
LQNENTPKASFSVFLIGDAGKASENEPTLQVLTRELQLTNQNSAVIFLGDNIYPFGLPDSSSNTRKEAEISLIRQLETLKNYEGKPIFIPGNHDWNMSLKGGLAAVKREEQFVENYLQRGNTFLPDSACPDAKEVFLTDSIVLLAIDTEWWFHKHDKPQGKTSYCHSKSPEEFLATLKIAIQRNQGKKIIVVGHHPIITNSAYFSWKSHIFPLTDFNKKWLLPLPILGSIYVAYRKLGFSRHDISHSNYKKLNKGLINSFANTPIIYAAGHDHNLQFHQRNKQYYVVSGSGSKLRDVPKRHKALFTANQKGFAVLRFYQNQTPMIEYFSGDSGKVIFRKRLIME